MSAVPHALQNLATGPAANSIPDWLQQLLNINLTDFGPIQDFLAINGGITGFQSVIGGLGYTASGSMFTIVPGANAAIAMSQALSSALAAPATAVHDVSGMPAGALGSTLAGSSGSFAPTVGASGAGTSAAMGRAAAVGGLSVPQAWGVAAPEVRLAATALPTAGLAGAPQVGAAATGPGWIGGVPPMAGMVNAPSTGDPRLRSGSRLKVIPTLARESVADEQTSSRWVFDGDGTLTERDELAELRRTAAELVKERDALQRSAAALIKEAKQL